MENEILIKGRIVSKSGLMELNNHHRVLVFTIKTITRGKSYTYLPCVVRGDLAEEVDKNYKCERYIYFRGEYTMHMDKQQIKVLEVLDVNSLKANFFNLARLEVKLITEPRFNELVFTNVITTIFSLLDKPLRGYLNIWNQHIEPFKDVKKEDVIAVSGYIRANTKKKKHLDLIGEGLL